MKIIVIGGGMSGCVSAIELARRGHNVTLLEANNRIGKKIAQTGNGRCNIMNINADESKYNVSGIVKNFVQGGREKVERFHDSIGLLLSEPDNQGRVYPITDTANSVVDCLRHNLAICGVNVVCDSYVTEIINNEKGVTVLTTNKKYSVDRAVLATGSNIAVKDYNSIQLMGKIFTPLCPSLTPIKVVAPYVTLNGIHQKANVTLLCGKEKIFEESGEVLFKEYGLSGIVILNLSSVIARRKVSGIVGSYIVSLDLFPQWDYDRLRQHLAERISKYGGGKEMLYGVVHNKIAEVVLKKLNISKITTKNVGDIAKHLKNMSFVFDSLLDKSMAQVMCGGIDEKYLDGLRIKNTNVYAVGEVLNIDGCCGGYNLYMATLCGIEVAKQIS